MVLWLCGDGTLVTDNDGGVISWNDQSGNSNHAAQICKPSMRPLLVGNVLNGKPVVRFDGHKDFLTCKAISALNTDLITWFIVFKTNDQTKNQKLIQSAYQWGARWWSDKMWGSYISDSKLAGYALSETGRLTAVKHPLDAQWHLQSVTWKDNDEVAALLDGENELAEGGANAQPQNHQLLRVGAGSDQVIGPSPSPSFTANTWSRPLRFRTRVCSFCVQSTYSFASALANFRHAVPPRPVPGSRA